MRARRRIGVLQEWVAASCRARDPVARGRTTTTGHMHLFGTSLTPPHRATYAHRLMSRARVVAIVVAVTVFAACSSTATVRTGAVAAPAQTSSLPSFYDVPSPLPSGQPGEIVKTEDVSVPGL